MIQIVDKKTCCGCTACYNACPKSAIAMLSDEEGFLYPSVDENMCTKCNICSMICPMNSQNPISKKGRTSYVVRTKNTSILLKSTSGGFVTPLAEWIWNNDGILCAATYNEKFHIIHKNHMKGESTELLRGSKYVQSYLGESFSQIKGYLSQGRKVCFIGTTCQVNGLKAFLSKEHDNLITVDLVCHGVSSPKLWDKYLNYQKNKYHSEILEISFRNKTYGYHSGTMKISFENGKTYYGSARVDYFLKSFFKEIASRPSCYACPFKTLERCSDFTIYDCWHATELNYGIQDDDKGFTNVIIQSDKGKKVFEQIKKSYEIYQVNTDLAVQLDGSMIRHSAKPHPRRNEFYSNLDQEDLYRHIQSFIPISQKDYIVEGLKAIMYRMKILKILKKLIRKRQND